MAVVVSDTGPLHYLVLIDAIDVLPALFGDVTIPDAVLAELSHAEAPALVRAWAVAPPGWCHVVVPPRFFDVDIAALGAGERAAIMLAGQRGARLVVMDDRAGVKAARRRGLRVTGTVGVLDRAARQGLIDLEATLTRLGTTTFRHHPGLFAAVLDEFRSMRRG